MSPIAIGADEAGAPLKDHLAKYLRDNGYEAEDYAAEQVLTMGGRVIAPQAAEKVLDHWLASEFEGRGSTAKVEKVKDLDARFSSERAVSAVSDPYSAEFEAGRLVLKVAKVDDVDTRHRGERQPARSPGS